MPTRVFVSFDYDYDVDLKNALIGQSLLPDSPFQIVDLSLKDASPDWVQRARARIRSVDQVVVLCGTHMTSAKGVDVEVGLARTERKPFFCLNGRDGAVLPAAAVGEKLYDWTWPNLRLLLAGAR